MSAGRPETGEQKADELMTRGREALREVEHAAQDQVERRSAQMAEQMESMARAMHTAAEELERDGRSFMASQTRRAAEQMDRMRHYLRDQDGPSMFRDVEEMARRHPGTFLGSSFAAGLAFGRFLRSSRPSDGHDRQTRTREDRPREAPFGDASSREPSVVGPRDTNRQLTQGGSHGPAY